MARQRVPRGRFRVESLLTAELPSFRGGRGGGRMHQLPVRRRKHQVEPREAIAADLRISGTGGLFLFDVAEPGRVPGTGIGRTYVEGDDWAVLVTNEEDRQRRLLTRRITSFRRVGDLYRRDQEVHRQRLLDRAELAAQLRSIGFRVRILRGYGTLRFGQRARRPVRLASRRASRIRDRERRDGHDLGSRSALKERAASGLARTSHLGYKVRPSHVTEPRRMGFFGALSQGWRWRRIGQRWAHGPGRWYDFPKARACALMPQGDDRRVLERRLFSPPHGGNETDDRLSSGCSWLRRSLDVKCRPGGPRRFGSGTIAHEI